MHLILVSDSCGCKNAKGVYKNIAAKINRTEYKDDLLNKKCLRHSINRVQGKTNRYLRNQQNFFVLIS